MVENNINYRIDKQWLGFIDSVVVNISDRKLIYNEIYEYRI